MVLSICPTCRENVDPVYLTLVADIDMEIRFVSESPPTDFNWVTDSER